MKSWGERGTGDWGMGRLALDPKSKIQNPKSKIQNPKSKIQNPKSKISKKEPPKTQLSVSGGKWCEE
jgi:hypothetical protein